MPSRKGSATPSEFQRQLALLSHENITYPYSPRLEEEEEEKREEFNIEVFPPPPPFVHPSPLVEHHTHPQKQETWFTSSPLLGSEGGRDGRNPAPYLPEEDILPPPQAKEIDREFEREQDVSSDLEMEEAVEMEGEVEMEVGVERDIDLPEANCPSLTELVSKTPPPSLPVDSPCPPPSSGALPPHPYVEHEPVCQAPAGEETAAREEGEREEVDPFWYRRDSLLVEENKKEVEDTTGQKSNGINGNIRGGCVAPAIGGMATHSHDDLSPLPYETAASKPHPPRDMSKRPLPPSPSPGDVAEWWSYDLPQQTPPPVLPQTRPLNTIPQNIQRQVSHEKGHGHPESRRSYPEARPLENGHPSPPLGGRPSPTLGGHPSPTLGGPPFGGHPSPTLGGPPLRGHPSPLLRGHPSPPPEGPPSSGGLVKITTGELHPTTDNPLYDNSVGGVGEETIPMETRVDMEGGVRQGNGFVGVAVGGVRQQGNQVIR